MVFIGRMLRVVLPSASGVWHHRGGPQHRLPDWGRGCERPFGQDLEAGDRRPRPDEELQRLELRLGRLLDPGAPPDAARARQERTTVGEKRGGFSEPELRISASRLSQPGARADSDSH